MRIGLVMTFIVFVTMIMSCLNDKVPASIDVGLMEMIANNSVSGEVEYFIMPDDGDYEGLPNQDPNNPITSEKILLGQQLFHEPGLAQKPTYANSFETYSCASCHIASKGFLPGRLQGIADGAFGYGSGGDDRHLAPGYSASEIDAQGTRPLSVMNVTYVTNTLWSGTFGANDVNVGTEDAWHGLAEVNHSGFYGLEAQNIEGFDLHRLEINERVLDDFGYTELFDKAFPDIPESQRYSVEHASFAMGAYLRSILTNRAPFQNYLKGQNYAITAAQKNGAMIFFGKGNCITCHNSPSFSAMNFYRLGTKDMYELGGLNTSSDDPRNLGRGMFTGDEDDMYAFKVPQLYNLQSYETFFHGSSKNSIAEAIDFKIAAQTENPKVAQDKISISPLSLSSQERLDLIDFLENALYDGQMERYVPNEVRSGYCFPNNDPQARIDLGCN